LNIFRFGWVFLLIVLIGLFLGVSRIDMGFLTWNLATLMAGLAAIITGVVFVIYKMDKWWFARNNDSPALRGLFIVVLSVAALAVIVGVLDSFGFSNVFVNGAIFTGIAIMSVLILRRFRTN